MAFTPRQFPIDPFEVEQPSRLPWSLDPSTLPDDALLAKQDNVLLVLGEPPLDAIAPLLYSPNLASSLVILATSREYTFPPSTSPAIRVLRLGVPLASSDSAASRLAAVLQWADSIATTWRSSSRTLAFEELLEDAATAGYQTPPRRTQTLSQRTSWFATSGNSSAPPSPSNSDVTLSLSRNLTPPKRSYTPELPSRTSPQRVFDALLDFLPPDAPDRHLLKHAILVTTLSRPFLATSPLQAPPQTPTKSRRFTFRGRPATPPASVPDVPPIAHIIHLIPPSRAALVRPLESFCLSFSFPTNGTLDVPRPYVMPPAALGDVLQLQTRSWTLAELVLCGAFGGEKISSASVSLRSLAKTNRAWIPGVSDITITGSAPARAISRRASMLPHMRPCSKTQVPDVMLPQPRAACSDGPQPILTQHLGQSDDTQIQKRAISPPIPARSPRRPSVYVSTSLRPIPSTSSLSAHATPTPSHAPPSAGPGPGPWRSVSSHRPSRPVSTIPMPARAATVSYPSHTPSLNTPIPDTKILASSVWPTPPSSAASSPSSSPELRAEASNAEMGIIGEENTQISKSSQKEVPSWDGTASKRKRRGLFAWIKR